jgi:dihydroorotate dehydrogenase
MIPVRKVLQNHFSAHSHLHKQEKPSTILFNLKFTNPIGLAAGYDKDAQAWRGLSVLGFSHIEVGTVTLQPQEGNPSPRIFRIPEEKAVINRMGFPGRGAMYVAKNIVADDPVRSSLILGVNIGKNKKTPNEEASQDYLALLEIFTPLADYLSVNVSSPNTEGLRRLQGRDYLEDLLIKLTKKRSTLEKQIPILVKLAPDLTEVELDDALAAVSNAGIDGIVATNTTIDRRGLKSSITTESGGLSGAPLLHQSVALVKEIFTKTNGRLPIIGVGGIMSSEDAKAMLDAGASLIQIYTGLIYKGPGLVKEILEGL